MQAPILFSFCYLFQLQDVSLQSSRLLVKPISLALRPLQVDFHVCFLVHYTRTSMLRSARFHSFNNHLEIYFPSLLKCAGPRNYKDAMFWQ